jgi:L-tartrate/succinate antiporter
MFLSALAPNLLALALVKSMLGSISPGDLVPRLPAAGYPADSGHAAAGLLVLPAGSESEQRSAAVGARELEKLGKLSRNEILLLVFVCLRC